MGGETMMKELSQKRRVKSGMMMMMMMRDGVGLV